MYLPLNSRTVLLSGSSAFYQFTSIWWNGKVWSFITAPLIGTYYKTPSTFCALFNFCECSVNNTFVLPFAFLGVFFLFSYTNITIQHWWISCSVLLKCMYCDSIIVIAPNCNLLCDSQPLFWYLNIDSAALTKSGRWIGQPAPEQLKHTFLIVYWQIMTLNLEHDEKIVHAVIKLWLYLAFIWIPELIFCQSMLFCLSLGLSTVSII